MKALSMALKKMPRYVEKVELFTEKVRFGTSVVEWIPYLRPSKLLLLTENPAEMV